jgi:hypothetical protein
MPQAWAESILVSTGYKQVKAHYLLRFLSLLQYRAIPTALFCDRLTNYLPRRALNHDPPDLCLLSSQDYRRELPRPAPNINFCITNSRTQKSISAVLCWTVLQAAWESQCTWS